ncbi:MAG TPA: hypothetical protein VMM13_08840, partial [Euzebya sp.]|nr:hypothetical protein [Euzebya sp.]
VTVAMTTDGLLVETLPALVGVPAGGDPPVPAIPALQSPDGDDPLATAVDRFLSALLTGDGELSRYLAVGASVEQPILVGRSVQLQRLAARPLDDSRVAALAEVRMITDDGAVHLLHYPLLLQPSDGRWEVASLLPALPLQPAAQPTTP